MSEERTLWAMDTCRVVCVCVWSGDWNKDIKCVWCIVATRVQAQLISRQQDASHIYYGQFSTHCTGTSTCQIHCNLLTELCAGYNSDYTTYSAGSPLGVSVMGGSWSPRPPSPAGLSEPYQHSGQPTHNTVTQDKILILYSENYARLTFWTQWKHTKI